VKDYGLIDDICSIDEFFYKHKHYSNCDVVNVKVSPLAQLKKGELSMGGLENEDLNLLSALDD
jgi:hypothetical protein